VCALVAFVAPAALVSCGAPQLPVTAVELPDAPRRPDGVVLEPEPAVPEVKESAASRGVVALREPLGGEAVVTIVHMLFRGFIHQDKDDLANLATSDAVALGPQRSPLLERWQKMLAEHDYKRLAGSEVARIDRIERYAYEDLGGAGAPARPPEMHPGEILVRVPVATPRVGSDQLFGDVVVLLLRRDGQRFRIAGFGEEGL
jgi:hypothetical protein